MIIRAAADRPQSGINNNASMAAGITLTAHLEQEPRTTLGFVDSHFDQACTGDVPMFLADVMSFAQASSEGGVVFP